MGNTANMKEKPLPWAALLPPAPSIFFGRNKEQDAICDLLEAPNDLCPHIAVLGAPGIGKTSVALSVAHDPVMVAKYGDRRFFVQCDSAVTSGALLPLIGLTLGIKTQSERKLRADIVQALSELTTLLILDNFEAPWEPYALRAETEDILACLGAIPNLTLLVTMRGTERPLGLQWSRPLLAPLEALSEESALQAFAALSDVSDDDPELKALLDVVDRMPLALTLMANMTPYESCARLRDQWNEMHTTMLQRGNASRLSSVNMSIQLSLSSARMQSSQDAVRLLSILALLPDGMDRSTIAAMVPSVRYIDKSIATLLQTALAYPTTPTRIRVLAPIRAYMLKHHPPADILLNDALAHVIAQTEHMNILFRTTDAKLVRIKVETEGTNYEAFLSYAAERALNLERTLDSLTALITMMSHQRAVSRRAIEHALDTARSMGLKALQATCLRRHATITVRQGHDLDITNTLQSALALASDAGDLAEETRCLLELAVPRLQNVIHQCRQPKVREHCVALAGDENIILYFAISFSRFGVLVGRYSFQIAMDHHAFATRGGV